MAYFNVASYAISRLSFLITHLVFAYWLNFIFNDPFNLRTILGANVVTTLDAEKVLPAGQCAALSYGNLLNNVGSFAVWFDLSLTLLSAQSSLRHR